MVPVSNYCIMLQCDAVCCIELQRASAMLPQHPRGRRSHSKNIDSQHTYTQIHTHTHTRTHTHTHTHMTTTSARSHSHQTEFVAVCCCSVLHLGCSHVAVMLPQHPLWCQSHTIVACWSVLECAAVYCSALQCVAVCCSVLQCVVMCCSVFYRNIHTGTGLTVAKPNFSL